MRQNSESRSERLFDAVLGDCLDALFAGATVEYCLRRYPEYAGELEPLLRTAAELQQTPPLTLSEVGFERGRQRVRQAVAALRNGRDIPAPDHVPMDEWQAPPPPPQDELARRPAGWLETLLLIAVGVAVVILLILSSPVNSPLYPLRRAPERVLTWLLGTPAPAESVRPPATPSSTLTAARPHPTATMLAQTTRPPLPTAGSPQPTITPTGPLPDTPTLPPSPAPPLVVEGTSGPADTATPTVSAAPTDTPPPTQTPTATATPAPTETATPTGTPRLTETAAPTATPLPTDTPIPPVTATPAPIPSPTPASTQTPTVAPTRTRVLPALPTATAPATSELPDLRLVDETQLTRREYAVFRAWSPDGERILFTMPRPPEAGNANDLEVWVMNRDGSDQRQLAVGQWPAFSPDGQHVAYTTDAGDDRSVWIVSVMGGEPQQVAGGATGRVFWPTDDTLWYPTAEGLRAVRLTPAGVPAGEPELRLPLAGLVEGDPGWVQWSVAPGGGAVLVGTPSRWWLVRLTPGEAPHPELLPAHSIWTEAWTRDGAAFAFVGEGDSLPRGLYLLGADGRSGPRLLVPLRELGDQSGGVIRSLNWSPDGSRLLAEWWSGSMGDSSSLYLVDRAGNYRLLAGLGDSEVLHWSPDGEWMAFHRAGNVWLARVEGWREQGRKLSIRWRSTGSRGTATGLLLQLLK